MGVLQRSQLDESYFGGKRGRGAAGKVVVFGILKRGGKVYIVVVNNAQKESLFPVITRKITPDSVVYTDCLSNYDVLDVSGFRHHRINHSKKFADRQNHINGIENFGNQAKRVLRKYNGIDRKRPLQNRQMWMQFKAQQRSECRHNIELGKRASSAQRFKCAADGGFAKVSENLFLCS